MESNFNNRHLYLLLDALKVSLYWKDLEGRYLGCNAYCYELAGLSSHAEIINKTDSQLAWYREARKIEKVDKSVFETKKIEIVEESAIINGEKRFFHSIKSPLSNEKKEHVGMIGLSIEITDLKRKEEAGKIFRNKNSQFIKNIRNHVADLHNQTMRASNSSADNSEVNMTHICQIREKLTSLLKSLDNPPLYDEACSTQSLYL